MNIQAKKELLTIARKSVNAAVNRQPVEEFVSSNPELQVKQGVFVTLKNKGNLRGCLGCFKSSLPLYKQVSKTAISTATEDFRFFGDPIYPSELDNIDIEISILSCMQKLGNPLDLELGIHGIYIKKGSYTGCFLPQVATETGWSKEEFLSKCCQSKAGLASNAWKNENVEVFVFTTEILQ